MVLVFKYGFEFDGFLYGWNNKDLYRLPSNSGNKFYGIKKLDVIKVGSGLGYRIKREKLSINQIKLLTVAIDKEYEILEDKIHIP